MREGRELTPIRRESLKGKPCTVCTGHGHTRASYTAEGLCRTHARRKVTGEDAWDRPVPPKAANGAGHLDKQGYRIVQHEGRPRREHHVFAELVLGRSLLPTEEVHHKNGHRSDNRTDGPFRLDDRGRLLSGNLEIWSTAQPAGQEIGPKLAWAVELLATYGQYASAGAAAPLGRPGEDPAAFRPDFHLKLAGTLAVPPVADDRVQQDGVQLARIVGVDDTRDRPADLVT
jgi:hypothetical protein